MQHRTSDIITVVCRGTARAGTHPKRRLARYQWSTVDGVWERVDRHGSDADWFVRRTVDGLQAYPRTTFDCPSCENAPEYEHETLQAMLQQAAEADEPLVI
jgi:hypothetical protein